MLTEDAAAEIDAVKAVFGDCIEDSIDVTQMLNVNIWPETGGVQVRPSYEIAPNFRLFCLV